MAHRLLLMVTAICVVNLAAVPVSACPLGRLDDPPAYQQWIQDLGSDSTATQEAARESLATSDAIPYLVTAVRGENSIVSRTAADILTGLLDSENTDIAGKAEQAVAELEKSSDEKVAAAIKAAVRGREQPILAELNKLGCRTSPSPEGALQISWGEPSPPQRDRSGKPVATDQPAPTLPLQLLRRLRRPFHFHASVANGNMNIGDLAALKDLDNLASLSLSVVVGDGNLSSITTLPHVRRLSVQFDEGSSRSELEPVAQLDQLEELALIQAPSLEAVFTNIARLPEVTKLRITFSVAAGASGLADLAKMPQIEVLSLENVPDAPVVLPQVAALKRLKQLTLRGRNITDKEMAYIGQATALEGLSLRETAMTDDGLGHLRDLPNLKGLQLQAVSLTDDALPHLLAMKNLEHFSANGSFLSNASLKQLPSQLPMQFNVDLHDFALEPEQRRIIRELTQQGIWVSPRRRNESGKPLLELSITATIPQEWHGDDAALNELIALGQIGRLVIAAPLGSEWIDRISELADLEEICLINTGLADEELQFLTRLPNLKTIELRGPFTDNSLPILKKTTAWRVDTAGTLISDTGRKSLTNMLTANRNRGKNTEQLEEIERAKAVIAKACEPPPKDRRERFIARGEKNQLRHSLIGLGVKAVPLLGDIAQNADVSVASEASWAHW